MNWSKVAFVALVCGKKFMIAFAHPVAGSRAVSSNDFASLDRSQ
jgi:hypothetical protein